jgi:4-hydroxy-tetrahydrodipicolinate synthase
VPPAITPLTALDSLDAHAYAQLLERMVEAGSSAIFILGSTGESPGLSARLRREAIDCAVAAVGGRIPILCGITDTSFVESLNLAQYAAGKGVEALVLSPPYYYALSQAAFLGYLEHLTAELPLPLYLYNMPAFTKIIIEPETVRAAADFPKVYGLKDSSGSREYFARVTALMADRPEFSLLVGIEEILAEMVMDYRAHGGVTGGANLHPELYVRIYQAAAKGDCATVDELQRRVLDISSSIYRVGDPGSSYLRGLKSAVTQVYGGTGIMAEPYRAMEGAERDEIRRALVRLGFLSNVG